MELLDKSRLSGHVLGRYSLPSTDDLAALVRQSRAAFATWKETPVAARVAFLRKFREYLVRHADDIAAYVSASTGKVPVEALAADVFTTLAFVKYYETNAARILRPQKRRTSLLMYNNSAHVEFAPLGCAFIICPWNYPLQLTLVPLLCALAAGNTVIIKPSEVTPGIGRIIAEMCRFAGLPEHVVMIAQGGRETVEGVIAARPDKVFFTGGSSTGQKIMELCARHLIPVDLELGGKDAMLVFADADLDRAVRGALYGAFANSGQMCVAAKRIYVERPVYEAFAAHLAQQAGALRVGCGMEHDIGAVTLDTSIARMTAQYADAVQKGAQPLNAFQHEGCFVWPVVVRDVTPDMALATEETFGPMVPVMPFQDEADAIRLANASEYGLNASVWTGDLARARRVASRIEAGSVYINDVAKNISNPDLPFGGIKQSGMGRYHGPEGLQAFCNIKAVTINHNRGGEPNWFPYSGRLYANIKMMIDTLYGNLPSTRKICNIFRLAGSFKRKP